VLVSLRHFTSIIDVKSSGRPNCNTDYYFVKTKVRARIVGTEDERSEPKETTRE
jgi:hypothetical protein